MLDPCTTKLAGDLPYTIKEDVELTARIRGWGEKEEKTKLSPTETGGNIGNVLSFRKK